MKKRKNIWLTAIVFMMAQSLAFPEILFPDCIRQKTEQSERIEERIGDGREDRTEEKTYEWHFWFLEKR